MRGQDGPGHEASQGWVSAARRFGKPAEDVEDVRLQCNWTRQVDERGAIIRHCRNLGARSSHARSGVHRLGVPFGARARWETIRKTTKEASWSIGSLGVIFGGIYGGVFTPTEAAGVAVVYSLFITMFIHGEVDLAGVWRILMASAFLISQILMIVTAAGLYSWLLTTSGMPQRIVAEINALQLPPWALLLFINVVLLVMGSFLEPPAAILILTPLLLPIVQAVGVSPVHFGIIMTVNLSIGMYTPPFGLNLFTSQAVFHAPLGVVYQGVLPFLIINF